MPRLVFVLTAALVLSASATAQKASQQYRKVDPIALPLDKPGVWTMHFAYTPPRIVTVAGPDGRPHQAWYMVYQVWNRGDTPQLITPMFELVTKDGKLQNFLDEPRPYITEAIRKMEDPTGALKLKTSVGMSAEKIPVTKPDSVPRAVYGVAVWVDAPRQAASSNNFSVYVSGLSNGLAVATNDAGDERISRKTLRIDLIRPTDNTRPEQDDFRPYDNNGLGAEKWDYRAAPATVPAVAAEPKKDDAK